MPEGLSKEEFAILDKRVADYSSVQQDIVTVKIDTIEEKLEKFKEYDSDYAEFTAYFIIEMTKMRINKDEVYAKLFFELMKKDDKWREIMLNVLFESSTPILRRVYDLGGFKKSDIVSHKAIKFSCFGDLFDNEKKTVKYGGNDVAVTKELIYEKYPNGTIERAILNDDADKFKELLKDKTVDSPIVVSPFDVTCDPKKETSLIQFALKAGSTKCVRAMLHDTKCPVDELVDYAIMSGIGDLYKVLKPLGGNIKNKFHVAAKYFNLSLVLKMSMRGEGCFVYNNIQTVYQYWRDVHDQVFDTMVYDLIDCKHLNDVTKWLLCVHGMSMYTGNKYIGYAVTRAKNKEIAMFIMDQGIRPFF
jgi:hypothetical protein